jgi:MFS transporter, DHA2 family, multidrug resistance protein
MVEGGYTTGGQTGLPDKSARLFITLAVMSATLIQVLDTTIVNVALPHMQGELSATTDQISWVLTSYLVTAAIFMPLTGYFSDILGRKRYLLICIAGFVIASALCGLATGIVEIVLFRMLQGVFGAALVPLSQAIMSDAYPPEERGNAMAIWGLGVMVGPVIGPTLGGWLTEVASWRWTFYINVPIGALSWFLASQFVPETTRKERKMDWPGLILLSMGVAGSQYALDRGTVQDWLAAMDIRVSIVLGVVGIIGFALYSWNRKERALFDIRIFSDRNFAMSCMVMLLLGLGMFGTIVVQPILLERLLNYPIMTTGLLMAPRGLATAFSMLIVGRLVNRVDPRWLVGSGMAISALGSYSMTNYSLDINAFWIVWPAMVQGLGMGLIFVPLSTIAYATLPRTRMAEAAGLYSLVRTMGSAIGISIVTTLMTRQGQVLWNELGAHVNLFNPAVRQYLQGLHLDPNTPQAAAVLAQQVGAQAQMLAMLDVFQLITWSFLVMLPLVFLLRRKNPAVGGPVPVAAE